MIFMQHNVVEFSNFFHSATETFRKNEEKCPKAIKEL